MRTSSRKVTEPLPENELLNGALYYAGLGWAVFPTHDLLSGACSCGTACPSPGKHPRTTHGVLDATTDPERIRGWWARWPAANVAIACEPSGLVVADVDVKKGAEGAATIRWFLDRFPEFSQTLAIATPTGGYHYYFRGQARMGQGVLGPGVDIRAGRGGYVLAPPSVAFGRYDEDKNPVPGSQSEYRFLRTVEPVAYPLGHVIETASAAGAFTLGSVATATELAANERALVPYGEHRGALLRQAWTMRKVLGLSVETALPLLRAFCETALEGYDRARPFTDSDLRKMLTGLEPHIATGPDETGQPIALAERIIPMDTILGEASPPREILLAGLVVRGELHTLYGEDGCGKSTIAAYILAIITRRDLDVLVFINEDLPKDFSIKFALCGGKSERVFFYREPEGSDAFLLPKHQTELRALLASRAWGAIYFDSIGDIKSADLRMNAADAARALFGPLNTYAQAHNVAIICTAHTNKAGVLEGARQVRAKSRCVAQVERPTDTRAPNEGEEFTLGEVTEATGFDPVWTSLVTSEKYSRGRAGAVYVFHFEERESINPRTHEVEVEVNENGDEAPKTQYVCVGHERLNSASPIARAARERVANENRDEEITRLLLADSAMSARDIYGKLGGRRDAVFAAVKRVRAALKGV
jgi:energy-coupling factor transporter ATP-binding protein EcfA2